jgi:hypothetical protein
VYLANEIGQEQKIKRSDHVHFQNFDRIFSALKIEIPAAATALSIV